MIDSAICLGAIEVTAWTLGIPSSEVYGAATSYSELRIERSDARVIRVCTGLSCIANGADDIVALESATGSRAHAESNDAAVALETSACGHLCALAPAIHVDGRWQGRAAPESAAAIVAQAGAR